MFGLLLILLGIGLGIGTLAQYLTSEFAITNKRVVLKTGLIRRQAVEPLLQKVEGMGVDQSILGRIMNYGTVVFSGTGGSADGFEYVSAPLNLKKNLWKRLKSTQPKADIKHSLRIQTAPFKRGLH